MYLLHQGDPDNSVFEAGMDALIQLSTAVGLALNPYLKALLVAVSMHL